MHTRLAQDRYQIGPAVARTGHTRDHPRGVVHGRGGGAGSGR
jgi:hypothetical protein